MKRELKRKKYNQKREKRKKSEFIYKRKRYKVYFLADDFTYI